MSNEKCWSCGGVVSPKQCTVCIAEQPDYRAMCKKLAEALLDTHRRCGCGHPHCNRCADDREVDAALAEYRKREEGK